MIPLAQIPTRFRAVASETTREGGRGGERRRTDDGDDDASSGNSLSSALFSFDGIGNQKSAKKKRTPFKTGQKINPMHPEEEDDDDDDDPSKEEGALPAFAHAAELFATVRQSVFLQNISKCWSFFSEKKL